VREGVDQLAQRHAQPARHEDERLERRRAAALLKLPDVVAGHACRVGKLFLRHPTTGTQLADRERQGATLARQGINHARQPVRAWLTLPDVALGMVPKVCGIPTRIGVGKPETTRPESWDTRGGVRVGLSRHTSPFFQYRCHRENERLRASGALRGHFVVRSSSAR
jgi:hypothetical protein